MSLVIILCISFPSFTANAEEEETLTPYEVYERAVELINDESIYAASEAWLEYYDAMPHLEEDVSEAIMKHELFYKAIRKGGGEHSYGLLSDESTEAMAENYKTFDLGSDWTEEEKLQLIETFEVENEWFDYPTIDTLGNDIYLLTIPTPGYIPSYVIDKYVQTIHDYFNEIEVVEGIIIDFRNNYGGYFPTVLASLAAFLPEGELLYYEDNEGKQSAIELKADQVSMNNENVLEFSPVKSILHTKVAIIINKQTVSTPEIVALMFENRDDVQIFGQNSGGFTSGLTLYYIGEDYYMYLATNRIVTLSGETYLDEPVVPDTLINFKEENVIQRAEEWLLK